MIRRLVDVNYLNHRDEPTSARVLFWLRELRSPELLVEAVRAHPGVVEQLIGERPLLKLAISENLASGVLDRALRDEEEQSGAWTRRTGSHCENRSSAFVGLLGAEFKLAVTLTWREVRKPGVGGPFPRSP